MGATTRWRGRRAQGLRNSVAARRGARCRQRGQPHGGAGIGIIDSGSLLQRAAARLAAATFEALSCHQQRARRECTPRRAHAILFVDSLPCWQLWAAMLMLRRSQVLQHCADMGARRCAKR